MRSVVSLVCGYIFGLGLFISGMIQPAKIIGFLDVLSIPAGNWDPSLAVVMVAALAVTGTGYALMRSRSPLLDAKLRWPTRSAVDRPRVAGAILFGIGWGLVGLCPGPAIENLAILSPGVIVFVIAMAIGMVAHNSWQARSATAVQGDLAGAKVADG